MQPPISNELDLRWFFPLFIGGWCAIGALLSYVGGWHELSKNYRRESAVEGRLFPFASMSVGPKLFPVSYGSCLFVRLGTEGIALSIFPIFRFLHPPLFIPWRIVTDCRRERFWSLTHTAIYLSEPKTRMLFAGRLGKAIDDLWTREHAQVQRTT